MQPTLSLDAGGHDLAHLPPGTKVTVLCHAQGGNPQPLVSLYKSNDPIGSPSIGENTYSFAVAAADNSAFIRCDSVNQVMGEPRQAELGLRVECE